MTCIKYTLDSDGIALLTMTRDDVPVNKLDARFRRDLASTVQRLKSDKNRLKGIILTSDKSTFFAGADLEELLNYTSDKKQEMRASIDSFKGQLLEMETLGVPLVAALNGSALGGGWEIALACHHRIAIQDKKHRFGLPEVKLGLLPGGGGVVRTTRLLGMEAALGLLTEGKEHDAQTLASMGLIHKVVSTVSELKAAAKEWINSHPVAAQPWMEKGYRIPGGTPSAPKLAMKLPAGPAFLTSKTKGCYPAPEAILKAAVEGLNVDFTTALTIETEYFMELVENPISHNMIKTFFFDLNATNKGASRPTDFPVFVANKVGILGAGMMGAGIAYAAAKNGIEAILKDVSQEQAEKGKGYSENLTAKRMKRGQTTAEEAAALLSRITPTADVANLAGCDLIIEAVYEDRKLKASVTQESETYLNDKGFFASNTSTLPITGLAGASKDATSFIGLHFFSPVDKMQLVEIIVGEKTSDETLAKAFDFVRQIKKNPIVVNDSRGFFTSRVFGTFTNEGIAMIGEGIAAASIERASLMAGMPVGPLAVSDEVSLSLMTHIMAQTEKDFQAKGLERPVHPAETVIKAMVAEGREGRKAGAGFYDYPKDAKKHLWSGLAKTYKKADAEIPFADIKDRLLYAQAIETIRCLEEGVLRSVSDGNIGSIFGFGFAPWSGGALQFVNHIGLRNFAERAMELQKAYGDRFQPPALLLTKAESQETF
ncbi:MAG: enoyl-CoA hydratase/isomerase family protein [Pseudobacteriovorax sp.]|nr:enoyl-CoA hydratase/isomerase family protein [Pseudobacteriovorax sp.]